jgi:hypothetical protein
MRPDAILMHWAATSGLVFMATDPGSEVGSCPNPSRSRRAIGAVACEFLLRGRKTTVLYQA